MASTTSVSEKDIEFEKLLLNFQSLKELSAVPADQHNVVINSYIQDFLAVAESALNLSYSSYYISNLGRSIVHKILCRQLEFYKSRGIFDNYEIIFDKRCNQEQTGLVYHDNSTMVVKLYGINSQTKIDRCFLIRYQSSLKTVQIEALSESNFQLIKETPLTADDIMVVLDENLIQVTPDTVTLPVVANV